VPVKSLAVSYSYQLVLKELNMNRGVVLVALTLQLTMSIFAQSAGQGAFRAWFWMRPDRLFPCLVKVENDAKGIHRTLETTSGACSFLRL